MFSDSMAAFFKTVEQIDLILLFRNKVYHGGRGCRSVRRSKSDPSLLVVAHAFNTIRQRPADLRS